MHRYSDFHEDLAFRVISPKYNCCIMSTCKKFEEEERQKYAILSLSIYDSCLPNPRLSLITALGTSPGPYTWATLGT